MIRTYEQHDSDAVIQIWLEGNIQAHDFVSPDYWRGNSDMVRNALPHAELCVHEDDRTGEVDGFIGLNGDFIEGLFVRESARSSGIGKQLLEHTKELRCALSLHVYRKNARAIRFYTRERFEVVSEGVDAATGEAELTMAWKR